MAKYRKKPVVIEAIQWKDGKVSETPDWLTDAMERNTVFRYGGAVLIQTLEGQMTAIDGDYILRGVKGEIYPCKPDIFEATYEKVEE